jgi:hypothetical protein
MYMLTLDEAIKHCLEVAEENDLAAGTYEILAENNHNAYERLTAETNSSRCAECAANHRQLAEWLQKLKDLLEENKVLISECDRLIKEKGELLKKSEQIAEYKRLLKVAVDDIEGRSVDKCKGCIYGNASDRERYVNCTNFHCYKWRYADEALKLIGDNENGITIEKT